MNRDKIVDALYLNLWSLMNESDFVIKKSPLFIRFEIFVQLKNYIYIDVRYCIK